MSKGFSGSMRRGAIAAAVSAVVIVGLPRPAGAVQVITNFGTNFTGTDALGRKYTSITGVGNGPYTLNNTAGTDSGYRLGITNPPGTCLTNGPSGTVAVGPYTNGFDTFNYNGGTNAPTGQAATLGYSGSVTGTSGYGNSNYQYNGSAYNYVPQVLLTLSNLDPLQTYSFDLFASRLSVGGDNRIADYLITGGSSGTAPTTLVLNTSENTGNVVTASGFRPDANNSITIRLSADAANTNVNKFYYLSVLEINSAAAAGTLVYTGSVSGNFDTSTLNFKSGTTAAAFSNGNTVVFDDTATGTKNVEVAAGGVSPASVTFNNLNSAYTFTGGPVAGTGSLTVGGGGTVTLNNANTYTGGTTVKAGSTLVAGNATAVGSGGLTVAGTFVTAGPNVGVAGLTSTGGLFSYVAMNGSIGKLTATSANLSGTTFVSISNSSTGGLTPGTTYPLMSSTGGGLGGSVIFYGRQNLTCPGNIAIQTIGGTAYRLTLNNTASDVTVTAALAPSHVINVMPLGSSNTAGFSAQSPYNGGGYRSQLYQELVNDGRFNPQFVGSSVTVAGTNPTAPDLMTVVGQTHHEGHGGYVTGDVVGNLNANAGTGDNDGGFWLKPGNGVDPDYITLNIGTNDYAYNANVTGVINNLDNILNQIFTLRPNATTIVSNIYYRGDNPAGSLAAQTNYNALVPALVYKYTLAGQHISFFDLYTLLTPANSLTNISSDKIHPTQAGYDVYADGWYKAITTGQAFYTGAAGNSWNASGSGTTSWAQDYQRTTDALAAPSAGTDVYFNGVGGTDTLGKDFTIRGLNFTGAATTPVTIGGTNVLTLGVGGITVQAGTGGHTLATAVAVGANQSWSSLASNPFTVSGPVSGGGALTIGGTGRIVLSGNNTFTTAVSLTGGTLVLGSATALSTVGVTMANNTTLALGTVDPSTGVAVTSPVTVSNSSSVTFQLAPTVPFSSGGLGPITVGAASLATVTVGSNPAAGVTRGVLKTTSVILSGPTSALELGRNDLDVTGQSLSAVTSLVARGFNAAGAAWTGPGIRSFAAAANPSHITALGVVSNSTTGDSTGTPLYGNGPDGLGLFDGTAPGLTDVLVRYTYYGDANLDGRVDGSDYSAIDNSFVVEQAGGASMTGWANGDFNYDGTVDGSDYTLVDNAFNVQAANLAAASLVASVASQISPVASTGVPEPASAGLVVGIAGSLLGRRTRRKN